MLIIFTKGKKMVKKTLTLIILVTMVSSCANKEESQVKSTNNNNLPNTPATPTQSESLISSPDPNYVDTCTEEYPYSTSTSDTLVIGDSISIGYVKELQKLTSGVFHSPCNAGHSYWGVNTIDKYLAARPFFKTITFNFGIWESYYGSSMTVQEYSKNLRYIGTQIKKKTNNPIFVTTTYVPPADQERMASFRDAAVMVMSELEIRVVDVYPLTVNDPAVFGPDGFHLSDYGYKKLADFIFPQLDALTSSTH